MINEIHLGDAKIISPEIQDGTIDLIFTDPPYTREHLHLYEWLGELGTRVLKPTGFLLVYCAPYYKMEIMLSLVQRLDYFWDYIEHQNGRSSVIWQRKTVARYKSILCFRPPGGRGLPVMNVQGVYRDPTSPVFGSKGYHDWGQSEGTARYFIDCFTREGDLVLDPFVGGGTVPAVAARMGRDYIGIDSDPEAVETTRARLRGLPPPGRDFQLELISDD